MIEITYVYEGSQDVFTTSAKSDEKAKELLYEELGLDYEHRDLVEIEDISEY